MATSARLSAVQPDEPELYSIKTVLAVIYSLASTPASLHKKIPQKTKTQPTKPKTKKTNTKNPRKNETREGEIKSKMSDHRSRWISPVEAADPDIRNDNDMETWASHWLVLMEQMRGNFSLFTTVVLLNQHKWIAPCSSTWVTAWIPAMLKDTGDKNR